MKNGRPFGDREPAHSAGKSYNLPSPEGDWSPLNDKAINSNLVKLDQILLSNSHEASYPQTLQLASPLSIDALEMLEAELTNQGILVNNTTRSPQSGFGSRGEELNSLTQRAALEASVWRWRGRRRGIHADFVFFVDVPTYVLVLAAEVEQKYFGASRLVSVKSLVAPSSEQPSFMGSAQQDETWALAQLRYYDCFAAYMTGAYQKYNNRFEQGLNVVLRVLGNSEDANSLHNEPRPHTVTLPKEPSKKPSISLQLPLSMESFLAALRTRI